MKMPQRLLRRISMGGKSFIRRLLDELIEAKYDLRSMVYPDVCMACHCRITRNMHKICPRCRVDIPLTEYWKCADNPVKSRFDGLLPIEQGSSFFFFFEKSKWRTVIHKSKYKDLWSWPYVLGMWYGAELKDTKLYDDVDLVVPVPLHIMKTFKRGYNQSFYFAVAIAKCLGAKVDTLSVRRTRNNPPQAQRKGINRWENVESLFRVARPKRLQGKHILVVDDVLTSGATLYACMKAIHNAVPDARISFATLAVTHHITRM